MARKIQVAYILDTTGSMGWQREVLKKAFLERSQKLFQTFPNVEIALIFIGDDKNPREIYSVEVLPFTRDPNAMARWMDKVGNSYGGGPHANYALGLRAARQLNWNSDAIKLVQVVGDEEPQEKGFKFHDGTKCEWEFEADQLVKMGATIDAVHCFPGTQQRTRWFYDSLARRGKGLFFEQDQFNDLEIIAVARIYRALTDKITDASPIRTYEEEVRSAGRMTRHVDRTFATLTNRKVATFAKRNNLQPVSSGQLQLLIVNQGGRINDFLADNGFLTAGGEKVKRFYRYTGTRDGKARREDVQYYKDIVLRDRFSGDFFSGDGVRTLLGLPLVGEQEDFTIDASRIPDDYDVFIESTSQTRKLAVGDEVLVDPTQAPSSRKCPCR